MTKCNPKIVIEEVTRKNGEDALSIKILVKRMKQMIPALKVLKIVNEPK